MLQNIASNTHFHFSLSSSPVSETVTSPQLTFSQSPTFHGSTERRHKQLQLPTHVHTYTNQLSSFVVYPGSAASSPVRVIGYLTGFAMATPGSGLEAIQGSNTFPRRKNVPASEFSLDSDVSASAPLKKSKLGRRGSKLGLKHLFGRKLSKAGESLPSPISLKSPSSLNSLNMLSNLGRRPPSRSGGGFRQSLADISGWPYGQQAKSELALSTPDYPWDVSHEQPDDSHDPRPHTPATGSSASSGKRAPGMSITKQPRPTLTVWTLPPLIRAYQQAHKQQTLSATTMPTETVLKLSEKSSVADMIVPLTEADTSMMSSAGISTGDKFRRRNRGDSLSAGNLQWTTKIYILVTAGYLLQYAGDGAIDRLPEKVLRLGASSAAFVTDMIPGRHFVLQVTSTTENNDRPPLTDPRSFLSKLSFRSTERRNTSNMIMVFENAEDMDGWMTCLRSMIERLGGKRSISEADLLREAEAKLNEDAHTLRVREKPSLKSISVRDITHSAQPNPTPPSTAPQQERSSRIPDYSIPVVDFDSISHDLTYDDKSATNSIASHDGRQLDNLRDSSQRLSQLSSGQRTNLTSTTSSPAGSPVRERFPLSADITIIPETARPRPNASVIANRRVSLQTMGPFIGEASLGGDGMLDHHQLSPLPWANAAGNDVIPSPTEPRGTHIFGVSTSQSTGRRASHMKVASALDVENFFSPPSPRDAVASTSRGSQRKLSNIRVGRPLSTVEDQPSPKENVMPERPVTSHNAETRPPSDIPSVPKLPRERLVSMPNVPQVLGRLSLPSRRLSLVPKLTTRSPSPSPITPPGFHLDENAHDSPRRLASLNALRKQLETKTSSSTLGDASPLASPATDRSYSPLPSPLSASWTDKTKKIRPSVDDVDEFSRGFNLGFSWAARRASFMSAFSDKSFPGEAHPIASIAESLPQLSPPPTGPLPAIPSRPSSSSSNYSKSMGRKKSLPRMAMPPPAPPPTCALPPLPPKAAVEA